MENNNNKDPAIRLFGKKIPLLPPAVGEDIAARSSEESEMDEDTDHAHKQQPPYNNKGWRSAAGKERRKQRGCCVVVDEEKLDVVSGEKSNKWSEEKAEANSVLKKPEKILPCPRCNSMDTKFCYYNNYNMKQPRHFCRACQRYWTAGGTMRNVPVGAGRRKNTKNTTTSTSSSSHYITISDALQAVRIDPFKPLPLLSFGGSPDHIIHKHDDDDQQAALNCFSWQYPGLGGGGHHVFYNPAGFPVLQAAAYNNNNRNSSVQKYISCYDPPTSPKLGKHSRDDYSYYSCLKQGDQQDFEKSPKQKNSSSTVLIPKTLRIDDPNDAAKSSIWETLGIKNESLINGGGIFRGFKSKMSTDHGKKITSVAATSPALLANPAAFSRSISFQETS